MAVNANHQPLDRGIVTFVVPVVARLLTVGAPHCQSLTRGAEPIVGFSPLESRTHHRARVPGTGTTKDAT
jgi:hypothetical protein